jgi:hypothetical protein
MFNTLTHEFSRTFKMNHMNYEFDIIQLEVSIHHAVIAERATERRNEFLKHVRATARTSRRILVFPTSGRGEK